MTVSLRLPYGHGPYPNTTLLEGLFNAAATAGSPNPYTIGPFSSADGGVTYTPGGAATITPSGTPGTWDKTYVKDPSIVAKPGGGYRCFYSAWNDSNFQIGYADASSVSGSWTPYAGNPIINVPNDGSYRHSGGGFPFARYDSDSEKYQLWITGSNVGVFTIGFLDSPDGVTWTDHGQVIGLGAGGSFSESHVFMGAVAKVGSTYYVLMSGRNASNITRSGYVTCSDPTSAASYSGATAYPNLASNLTIGGYTWQSNQPHMLVRRASAWLVGIDVWNPTPSDTHEGMVVVTTTDLATMPVPGSTLMVSFASWYANSAENPTALFI